MVYDEKTMCFLEQQIPELAKLAFKKAYWDALNAGLSVVVREGAAIYEVFPDGTKRFVQAVLPPTPAVIGEKRELR